MTGRSGRRPGRPDTRQAILAAARELFADKGFDHTSIRTIAAAAGVDPALVHHYFGTKDQLFLACIEAPINPAEVVGAVLTAPRDQLGIHLVRVVLNVWESPAGAAAVALLRSAMNNQWTARLLREFLTTQILRQVVGHLGLDDRQAETRTALAATQVLGLVVGRYILRLEPIASALPEQLVAAVGPSVHRYLTDDLPGMFPVPTPQAPATPGRRR